MFSIVCLTTVFFGGGLRGPFVSFGHAEEMFQISQATWADSDQLGLFSRNV